VKKSGNTTANLAAQILIKKKLGFVLPTAQRKRHLVVVFEKRDMIVYGKAFDILRLAKPIDLDSLEEVETHLKRLLCTKSNRRSRTSTRRSTAISLASPLPRSWSRKV
jgi:hypothetical protein